LGGFVDSRVMVPDSLLLVLWERNWKDIHCITR